MHISFHKGKFLQTTCIGANISEFKWKFSDMSWGTSVCCRTPSETPSCKMRKSSTKPSWKIVPCLLETCANMCNLKPEGWNEWVSTWKSKNTEYPNYINLGKGSLNQCSSMRGWRHQKLRKQAPGETVSGGAASFCLWPIQGSRSERPEAPWLHTRKHFPAKKLAVNYWENDLGLCKTFAYLCLFIYVLIRLVCYLSIDNFSLSLSTVYICIFGQTIMTSPHMIVDPSKNSLISGDWRLLKHSNQPPHTYDFNILYIQHTNLAHIHIRRN